MKPAANGRITKASANRFVGLLFVLGLVLILCVGGLLWYAASGGLKTSGLTATISGSAAVNLAWNRSPSPKVTGYWILSGTQAGMYTNAVDVGNAATATLRGLKSGTKYYVVVVAVDAEGNRSPPSNELEVVPR